MVGKRKELSEDVRLKQGLLVFVVVLFVYLLTEEFVSMFSESQTLAFALKIVFTSLLLIHWRKWFAFKPKFDLYSVFVGICIALIWFGLEGYYPLLGELPAVSAFATVDIILKLAMGVMLAPIVEEFFTRFFLHRFLEAKNWLKVPLGHFSWVPFIITTLFFGFAHGRWLVGLISGILLNLLWYKKKDMNSVVMAHLTANLVLGILVIVFQRWEFWL